MAPTDYLDAHPKIEKVEDLKKLRGIAYVPDLIYDKELDYIPLVGRRYQAAPDLHQCSCSTGGNPARWRRLHPA